MHEFLFGEESWTFLPNVAIRALVMFVAISVGLRLVGKRGIKQLSVYELGVIVGLGSAAGDPMFYKDVGIVPALVVFVVVIGLYRIMETVMEKSSRVSRVLEGEPVQVIRDGRIVMETFEREDISRQELFAQLRFNKVSNLAQVRVALIEPTGDLSVFFYPDADVGCGLPLLPELYDRGTYVIARPGTYACTNCGEVAKLDGAERCRACACDLWVPAVDDKRIT